MYYAGAGDDEGCSEGRSARVFVWVRARGCCAGEEDEEEEETMMVSLTIL